MVRGWWGREAGSLYPSPLTLEAEFFARSALDQLMMTDRDTLVPAFTTFLILALTMNSRRYPLTLTHRLLGNQLTVNHQPHLNRATHTVVVCQLYTLSTSKL